MIFNISFDKQPQKFIKKCDQHILDRLYKKIRKILSEKPVPSDAKTVVNAHGVFRIRIGDFRVLYRINYEKQKIVIVKLEKRARAYQ